MRTVVHFFLIIASTFAAGAPLATSTQGHQMRANLGKKSKPKAPTIEQNQSPFSLGFIYSLGQDLAEQTKPKRYKNYLTSNFGYAVNSRFTLGAELGLSYVTLDGKPQENSTGNYGTVDFNYDVGGSYKTSIFTTNTLKVSSGISIPTDDVSRYEGIVGLPYLNLGLTTPLYSPIWTIDNSIAYIYTINRYDTSASGESNAESSVTYSTGTKFKFKNGFSFGFGAAIKLTRYLDDFVAYSYNNTQTIAYSWSSFSTSLSHINGGFVEKGEVDLWFVDKYRRYVTWRLSYAF